MKTTTLTFSAMSLSALFVFLAGAPARAQQITGTPGSQRD